LSRYLDRKRSVGAAKGRHRHLATRAIIAVQHLLQVGDIRSRLLCRQIGLDDGFGLGKAALQADHEAEKKAAALPPKLTVPMILFFLPVLFVVILGPTGIKVSAMMN